MNDRYFFIHVMKTSGTSFLFYMRQALGDANLYPPPGPDLVRQRVLLSELRAAGAYRGYTGHFPAFAAEIVGATKTVTILRDPVERTISMLKQHQRLRAPDQTLEAIYADPDVSGKFLDNHQTKVFAMDASDEPESVFDFLPITRARFDAAAERLARCDVVGFQEDHSRLLATARQAFGWPPPEKERHAFVSPPADLSAPFRERIAEDMAWDRELYDFARGLRTT